MIIENSPIAAFSVTQFFHYLRLCCYKVLAVYVFFFYIYMKKPLAPRHCDGLLLFFFMTSDLTCASAVLIVT